MHDEPRRRPGRPTAWKRRLVPALPATVAAGVLAIASVACGDENEGEARAAAAKLTAPLGKPLPPELVGAWYERPMATSTRWRTTLMAAGHEVCLEVVRTRGSCFLGEAASGGAVVQADQLGQPRLENYGEVGVNGEELVFRFVGHYTDSCEGSRHTAAWTLRDDERLVLKPTSRQCDVPGMPTFRFDRAG